MSEQPDHTSAWKECAPGTLARFCQLEKGRRTMRFLGRVGAVAGTACVLFAVSFLLLRNSESNQDGLPFKGGLACPVVIEDMEPFFADQLDVDYRVLVVQHLKDCPMCRHKYDLHGEELGSAVALNNLDHFHKTLLFDRGLTPMPWRLRPLVARVLP